MGCGAMTVTTQKMRGRGTVTTEQPTAGNGWRGGITIVDAPGSSAVYDVRVTLACSAYSGVSATQAPVRLSCTHNYGTGSCHMGRIEVYAKNALHTGGSGTGTWGSVCGHYIWDNDNYADIACKQLGYASGSIYTFGATKQLPTLPIVEGFRTCDGTEASLFGCPTAFWEPLGEAPDIDCKEGCLGADGEQGTVDDTLQSTCTHHIDQGAICHGVWPSQTAMPTCTHTTYTLGEHGTQPVVFGCIDYYTTKVRQTPSWPRSWANLSLF